MNTTTVRPMPPPPAERAPEPWTWRDWVAMALSYLLIALLGLALWFPDPFALALLAGTAGAIVIAAFVLDALRKPEIGTRPTPERSNTR